LAGGPDESNQTGLDKRDQDLSLNLKSD